MRKVVILEDDNDCMIAFQAVLARAHYEPLPASTCSDVQQRLADNTVDVLILDVFLRTQWCHGTDVALRAQKTHPAIKILFVSGTAFGDWNGADRRNLTGLAEGSWDILQKPFIPATLLSALSRLLDRPPSLATLQTLCPHNRDCAELNQPGTGAPVRE